jgi:dolichol-phosphate mannosyltransferase|tara:strand:- start:20456 stop:21130 length:675 start_codon:yes stop_codon:yes gene_type:complete
MKNKITIVIPTLNEEKTIKSVIKGVKPYSDEIIVVDAKKAKDKTADIAKSMKVKVIKDNGKGHGAAKKIGMRLAKNPIIVLFDADGSHDPKDIPKMIKHLTDNNHDLVVGSRMTGGSDELHGTFSNFARNIGAGLIQLAINYRFNVRLTDCENGFRAIKKKIIDDLDLQANDFDIEEEMVIKALKKGYSVGEVPTHEYERQHGESNLSLPKMGYKFVWRLVKNL